MPAKRQTEAELRSENRELKRLVKVLEKTVEHLEKALGTFEKTAATLEKALEDQTRTSEHLAVEVGKLRQRLYGRKSEKMPSVHDEIAKEDGERPSPEETRKKRRAKKQEREQGLKKTRKHVPVVEEKRCCPACKNTALRVLGEGRTVSVVEYRPPEMVLEESILETLACACGHYIVTADAPPRPFEQSPYGPRITAHVIVTKLLDAIPTHRLSKILARSGVKMPRQTMTDLLYRAADRLEPLSRRLLELIAMAELVRADETPQRRQKKVAEKAFIWAFLGELQGKKLIGYRYSVGRSGDTPVSVLGDSTGFLLVDLYSGYNEVTIPGRRRRAGCWAHVRRRFFELRKSYPELKALLLAIKALYRVEHKAKKEEILGTPEHLTLRHKESLPILRSLFRTARRIRAQYPPKSDVVVALNYMLKNRRALMTFLRSASIELDNNKSENALRSSALGRKNWLFTYDETGGEKLASLRSLVATCVANGVNPEVYLADVLIRVNTVKQSELDTLLPHQWQPVDSAAGADTS